MLKKIILFIVIIICLITVSITLAQEKNTSSPTSNTTVIDDEKVQALKEKLATKVAELRENQTRGFTGEIAALNKTSFTLVTQNNNEVKVRFNEDAQIYKLSNKKTAAEIKDLKNTLTVSVLGIYDTNNNQISANLMLIENILKYYNGEVTQIDKTNGLIVIKNSPDKNLNIDYDKTTLAVEYDIEDKKIIKSGLSKINIGDILQIWGNINEEDNEKITSSKILKLPKELFLTAEEIEKQASPSASLKPTPIASPKASPKASLNPKAS